MKIFQILPGASRSGGIKVAQQWIYLLNKDGYKEAYFVTPRGGIAFDNYPCNTMTWEELKRCIQSDDILICNWAPDIDYFDHLQCRKIFLSQGCGNPEVPGSPERHINNNWELITITQHGWDFYYYGYKKNSKIVNNWINNDVFYSQKTSQVKKRIGLLKHTRYYTPEIIQEIKINNYPYIIISGTENEVAEQMRTCEYFIQPFKGAKSTLGDLVEGWGLPGTEAMACGCILITYNTKGVLEYAYHLLNCIVVQDINNSLIDQINYLENNFDLKQRLISNAQITIKERFNDQVIFQQIKEALRI